MQKPATIARRRSLGGLGRININTPPVAILRTRKTNEGCGMKTDRELLELAAKAAGYERFRYCPVHMGLVPEREDEEVIPFNVWNPLTDDGDALRLAVKLQLLVDVCDSYTGACNILIDEVEQDHGDDPCSATRRAIVRAAAAIGEAME